MATIVLKVSGTPDQINTVIDFLPTDLIRSISEKKQNSEKEKIKHQFLHLDAAKMEALVEVQKEVSKQFVEVQS